MYFFVVLAVAVGYIYLKRSGQISQKQAVEYLKSGALVIDVRTPNEFSVGHLMPAENMPLDRIDVLVPSAIRNKDKVMLLHCTTGIRSKVAKKKLEALGYKNVYNLGSYDRAEKIVSQR
jgi:phage shock protein E